MDPTDDKIERLVRSVLDAVDARLGAVREEIRELAAEMDTRHRQVTTAIGDVERRIARQAAQAAQAAQVAPAAEQSAAGEQPATGDPHRMEQATQMLLERIEAMHQRTTIANNERFAHLTAAIDELRSGAPGTAAIGGSGVAAGSAGPSPDHGRDLSLVTAPLLSGSPVPGGPATGQAAAGSAARAQHTGSTPAVPPLIPVPTPAPAVEPAPATTVGVDAIDLDRLGSLLSERLGKLHLGTDADGGAR